MVLDPPLYVRGSERLTGGDHGEDRAWREVVAGAERGEVGGARPMTSVETSRDETAASYERWGRASLRSRGRGLVWPTTVAMLVATVLPVLLLGLAGTQVMRAALTERLLEDLEEVADAQAGALALAVGGASDRVALISTRTQVRRNLDALIAGDLTQRRWLTAALEESRDVSEDLRALVLTDPDGRVMVATDATPVGERHPGVPQRGLDATVSQPWSTVTAGDDLNPGIRWFVAMPMVEDDVLVGTVVAQLELGVIAAVVGGPQSAARGFTSCVIHTDEQGQVISLVEPVGSPLSDDTLRLCGGPTVLTEVAEAAGVEVLAAVRPLTDVDFLLTVSVPRSRWLEPLTDLLGVAVVLTGALLALAAVAAVLLARRLTRPIRDLRAAAVRVEAGDLDVTAPTDAPGEIGALAEAFNAMAASVRDSQADLEQRYADLEVLAHAMAHDLKAPLTSVRGTFDLLSSDRVTREEDRALLIERGGAAALRMQRSIDDLLTLIRAIGAPLVALPVPLDEVVAEVGQQLGIVEHVHSAELPVVAGDRILIEHVLLNLLSNAVQYRDVDQPLRIEVSTRYTDNGMVEVCVDDAGIGIPAEERETVLGLFVRGQRGGHLHGSGLGLPIALRAVQRHGGSLWIDDAPLGGTRVAMTLPRHPGGSQSTQSRHPAQTQG